MPTLARPEVDVLDGLTTAIIVDQERMGANTRSTVGTATDANAMLRILFSRLGKPHIGSPQGVLVQHRDGQRRRCDHDREGGGPTQGEAHVQPRRRHVPALRGHGLGHRLRPDRALRRQQVAQRGRARRSPATAWTGGTAASSAAAASSTPTSRSASSPRRSSHDLLYKEPTKIKVDGINLTVRGADPDDPEVVPVEGRRGDAAAHPRVRRAGDHLHRRVPTATAPASTPRARSSKINGINIADACAMQISDLAEWVRGLDEPSVAPLLAASAAHARLVRRDRAGLPLARPAVGHAVGRRGASAPR